MIKKILSLLICAVLILSTFTVVPASAASGHIADGYLISEDFEDGKCGGFSAGTISDRDNGKAIHLTENSYYTIDLPDYYIFEFDFKRGENFGYPVDVSFKDSNAKNVQAFALVLMTAAISEGTWYTYRFAVDQEELSGDANDVYTADGIKAWRKTEGSEWESISNNTHFRALKSNAHGSDGTVGFYAKSHTQYEIDNVKMCSGSFVSETWFEDASGKAESIPDGKLTAFYALENYGGFEAATAVTAIYDQNNQMLECIETPVSGLVFGSQTVTGATVDISEYPDSSRVEAFLWSGVEKPQPMGSSFAAIGDVASAESSQTTTTSVATAAGANYANNFTAIDRSTMANTITIEGVHSKGEKVPVIVKITAGTSTVVASQFMTAADGTFKKTFTLNPALCGSADTATVVVAGTNTNPQTFDIPVSASWEAMKADFADATTEDEIESYLNTYKDSFTYLESGSTVPVTAEVETLNQNGEADDYTDIEFVKNKTVYSDSMTYDEVVNASIALVKAAAEVDTFEEAYAEAKVAENAEEIQNLIENAEFITFPLSGVSNLAKVYENLSVSIAETETIAQIYADFVAIHGAQKAMEEATIPSFMAVNSGETLKQFFADNKTALGIDPEKYVNEEYDDDYAVMYGAYEGQFELCNTYEKVNSAIVFLDSYINEYNAFLDSVNAAEDGAAIGEVLEAEYLYIELGLVNSAQVVNREYLYAGMEDTDFASLGDVRTSFAAAVSAQAGREANVFNDFMLIMSEEEAQTFFETYGEMIGTGETVNVSVFYEVYSKFYTSFENTVINYSTAVAQAKTLLAKVEDAEEFIADVNEKAAANDWTGLKALYEGEKFAELIGISTATTDVNDIRSMYSRIAAAAAEKPFANLTQVRVAFENARRDQANYEEIAGGYETFDEELLDFVESAWVLDVQGNVITLKGKVEERGLHNISLYIEDKSGFPIYMKQTKSKAAGDFEVTFILNHEFYTEGEKAATLTVSGDSMNVYVFSPFDLYSEEKLLSIVEDFVDISSESELEGYIDTYEEILGLDVERDASGQITDRALEALYLVYSQNKKAGKYDELADISEVINGKDGESGTEALMITMGKIITCLDELTAAANERVGMTVGNWSKIQKQVELAMKNNWISPNVSGGISSVDKLYMRMAEKNYGLLKTVETEYENAYKNQYADENEGTGETNGGDSFGGGGGGGSSSSGGDGKIASGGSGTGNTDGVTIGSQVDAEKSEATTNLPGHPEAPFSDVTSEYSWAKDSINGLRRYGIVRGDGNGLYRPGDGISREEFLKILLDVFAIERTAGDVPFSDADENAWYYDTVATAYSMGIVNGYPDGRFGIGDKISRADMAVMICRAMETLNISLDATDEAFLFNDFTDIPEYAYASVVKLQRAGILNGDTFGYYNPRNFVTRAESAVAFWSIFNGVKDIIDYNWVTEYN